MKKYLVIDESTKGDRYETVCETPDAANTEAARQWEHLTADEQKTRHIYAVVVRKEDLTGNAVDEDTGEIDWRCFSQCSTFPDAFDSAK